MIMMLRLIILVSILVVGDATRFVQDMHDRELRRMGKGKASKSSLSSLTPACVDPNVADVSPSKSSKGKMMKRTKKKSIGKSSKSMMGWRMGMSRRILRHRTKKKRGGRNSSSNGKSSTDAPTVFCSEAPSAAPTSTSAAPSSAPSTTPSTSAAPSSAPSTTPSKVPTSVPSASPSAIECPCFDEASLATHVSSVSNGTPVVCEGNGSSFIITFTGTAELTGSNAINHSVVCVSGVNFCTGATNFSTMCGLRDDPVVSRQYVPWIFPLSTAERDVCFAHMTSLCNTLMSLP